MADRWMIEMDASAATSQVRAREFPSLEEGNISFPRGRYLVDFERLSGESVGEGSFALTHRIEDAPLLERLIEEDEGKRKVRFVCMVSSPFSSYRSTEISETARQVVKWHEDDLGEPPLFTPMIVVSAPFTKKLDEEQDGVHPLWHGQSVDFEPGMRLAVCDVVQLMSSILELLFFSEDTNLEDGQFRVEEETDGDFRFRVNLASDLHRFLNPSSKNPARWHVFTHVVSACLSLLKSNWAEDSEDEGWRSYRGLRALSEKLKEQGLSDWTDPEFSPELAATKIHPHRVPLAAVEEVEE